MTHPKGTLILCTLPAVLLLIGLDWKQQARVVAPVAKEAPHTHLTDSLRTSAPTEVVPKRVPTKIAGSSVDESANQDALAASIQRAVRDDDLCLLASLTNSVVWESPVFFDALTELSVPGADGAEIIAPDGPLARAEAVPQTPAGRFARALSRGGLITSSKIQEPKIDRDEARQELLALEAADPGNAAYPYFRLGLESLMDLDDAILFETARRIASGVRFETHFLAPFQAMRRSFWRNPSTHLFLRGAESVAPWPDYSHTNKVLQRLRLHDPLLTETIGRLMTKEALEARRGWQSLGYNVMDYSLGRALMSEPLPTYLELDKRIEGREEQFDDGPYVDAGTACSREDYDRYFKEMRGTY